MNYKLLNISRIFIILFVVGILGSCGKDNGTNANNDNNGVRPFASFKIASKSLVVGDEIQFKDQSFDTDGEVVKWNWDFGDGDTSEDQNPTHTYSKAGKYTVKLKVTDNDGLTNKNDASKEIAIGGSGTGSKEPTVLWKTKITYFSANASPAVSDDNIVYVPNDNKPQRDNGREGNFFAIKNGSIIWKYSINEVVRSTPTIDKDGTVYIGGYDKKLHAFKPNGDEKWSFDLGANDKYSSVAIGDDGTLYLGAGGDFFALTQDGQKKWELHVDKSIYASPAIGKDGTIYFTNTGGTAFAVSEQGDIKWKKDYGAGWSATPVAIGPDNTIYFAGESSGSTGVLTAYKPDGTEKWKANFDHKLSYSGAVVGKDGVIYVGSRGGKKLFAITPDGKLKWSFDTNGEVRSTPAIDNNGNIYFGDYSGYFYVVTPKGLPKYQTMQLGTRIFDSPVIGKDGTIYITAGDDDTKMGTVYALKTDATGPLPDTWPMYGKNNNHTANNNDK
jgi:outer membrane protein assembly factor BamB/plastocyanin